MKDLLEKTSLEYSQLMSMTEFLHVVLENDKVISKKDVSLFLDRMLTLIVNK